jgi:hypothetical protein
MSGRNWPPLEPLLARCDDVLAFPHAVKFYAYIADSKLDRLLAELSAEDRQRLASELDLEAALLHLPQVQRGESDETRFARVAAVAHHLEQSGATGVLESDHPYLAGAGDVRWGRFRRIRGAELLVHESESPVSFGFAMDSRELLMAGSASKLLAQPPTAKIDEAARSAADQPWFSLVRCETDLDDVDERCLAQVFGESLPPSAASDPRSLPRELRRLGSEPISCAVSAETLAKLAPLPWMEQLARLQHDLRALPNGRLEFLAKRVATFVGGRIDPTQRKFESTPTTIVAAPLYVAMTL